VRELRIAVYGRPQPAGSKRFVGRAKNGRGIVIDSNPKAGEWKDQVAQVAGEAMDGAPLMRGPLKVSMLFTRSRPKAHLKKTGKLRDSAPRYPVTKPDVLKLARGVEDALTGVVWGDDAQIVEEVLWKHYGESEGVQVLVQEIEA
jgi:Holliday junction resolvase RusA-like endonuclease